MRLNILHITPDFNYACGRSYYVYLLMKYFKKRRHHPILITNSGDSIDRLKDIKADFKIIKSLHSRNPLLFAKNVAEVNKIIIDNNIHIIHTHHRFSELLAIQSVNLLNNSNIKTVFTALSLVDKRYNIEFKSDKLIAVSDTVRNMLIRKFGVNENKIQKISNFTDTEELHELEKKLSIKHHDGAEAYNILSIGRYHPDKNYIVLFKALNILKDRNIKLVLIGEGDCIGEYKRYINSHKLNIELVPPQKRLHEYFINADLCVLPSVCDPFPNFMLQAGLHKKPFIGSNIDGIAELILNYENGLLFESDDETELAQKILQLKNNRRLASHCANNLHKDVITGYTEKTKVPQIEKLYHDIIKK